VNAETGTTLQDRRNLVNLSYSEQNPFTFRGQPVRLTGWVNAQVAVQFAQDDDNEQDGSPLFETSWKTAQAALEHGGVLPESDVTHVFSWNEMAGEFVPVEPEENAS
jgi:hypothetical protein